MKITMEFESENPDDMRLHMIMLKAQAAHDVLREVRQQIFRPARKHGYSDIALNKLIEGSDELEDGYNRASSVISILEDKFNEILKDYSVDEDGSYE